MNTRGMINTNKQTRRFALILALILAVGLLAGCGGKGSTTTTTTAANNTTAGSAAADLSGKIVIDGSSTVFPITEAIAEEFSKLYQKVEVPVGFSGTGGGFKKFTAGETDISNASRPIKDSEKELAVASGVEYVELMVAYDGISVVVNKENDWAKDITIDELKKIWAADSTVMKWSDVRSDWPAETINLYGPGTDSGTFEYFTEAINGEAGNTRKDFTPSEDDNVLVQGVAGDTYAMGYFGFAYYEENMDKLNVVAVDNGAGAIVPTMETIKDGSYAPLSRPLFMYVNKKSLTNAHVKTFVDYFMTTGTTLISSVGYVPLTEADYVKERAKLG